jgi:hypothetical protein
MAVAKRGSPKVMLIGERAGDGKMVTIFVYEGGHSVERELHPR